MVGNIISFFWTLFSDLYILMRYIFQRCGISLTYLILGMVIVTALFNYVFSPFLKGTGFLSGARSRRSAAKARKAQKSNSKEDSD